MNKHLFTSISDHLKAEVPELKWIDYDSGQLDLIADRPPLTYPACLIDITLPRCSNITNTRQLCDGNIALKLIFKPMGASNSNAAAHLRDAALGMFTVIDKVHTALQGWHNNYTVSELMRTAANRERRTDGLAVYRLTYTTTFKQGEL